MKKLLIATALVGATFTSFSQANERKFSYTYQTATLPEGAVEVETWNTYRYSQNGKFYSALDQRFEVEWGVSSNAQVALYTNMRTERKWKSTKSNGVVEFEDKSAVRGLSLEFKQQLLNPALAPVGFAYYLETGLQAKEIELEGKLLFDKSFGPLTTAINFEGEVEIEPESKLVGSKYETEFEAEKYKLAADLGLNYAISEQFGFGLESRIHTVSSFEDDAKKLTAVFVGPSVNLSGKNWWAATTVLKQVGTEEYVEHQKIEARLLIGLHF